MRNSEILLKSVFCRSLFLCCATNSVTSTNKCPRWITFCGFLWGIWGPTHQPTQREQSRSCYQLPEIDGCGIPVIEPLGSLFFKTVTPSGCDKGPFLNSLMENTEKALTQTCISSHLNNVFETHCKNRLLSNVMQNMWPSAVVTQQCSLQMYV